MYGRLIPTLDYYYSFNELSKLYLTMPATIAKAFIPRILGNVTVSQIRDAFAAKQIGKVKNIDIHRRKNEKNNQYSFAFIEIALYDTKEATDLCEDILDNGSSKVFYDRKNYWEVKAFLTKSERATASTATATPTDITPAFVLPAATAAEQEQDQVQYEDKVEIQDICDKLRTIPLDQDQSWLKVSMHSQLLHAIHKREMEQSLCYNCGSSSNPECQRSIFWQTYAFCSYWCQYDTESDIRTSWLKAQRTREAMPTLQINADNSASSKFIAMFERIHDEAAEEMHNIRDLCSQLIKRPTAFTAEDRDEMARDYEVLEKEMTIA